MPKVYPKRFDNPALEILWQAKLLRNAWNDRQQAILFAFDERCVPGYYFGFGAIATDTALDVKLVRVLARRLARKGLLEYKSGLFTEDGEVAGAGYGITDKGRTVVAILKEPEHED